MSFRWKATACCVVAAFALDHSGAAAQQPIVASAVVQQDYEALAQQMYQSPSDLDVSFKFAEQAVARGDYEAAIGALQRMLLTNPDLPRVRLQLGVLYFKLGSFEIARGYFQEALKGADLPAELRGQVMAYLAEIDRRLSRDEYTVFLHGGVRHQSNANVGPNGLQVRALGQDAVLDAKYGKQPDWNAFQTVVANYAHKLDLRGDAIEVGFLGLDSRQNRLSQFNLGLVELTLGQRVAIGQSASFKVYGIGDKVWLGDADYFNAAGGGLSARTALGSLGSAEALVESRHRRFVDSTNYPTASEQSGDLLTAAIATDLTFGQLHWTTRLGYDSNQAVVGYNSYKRTAIDMAVPIAFAVPLFGTPHQFVFAPTAGYSSSNYQAANLVVDPTVRRDKEYRVGAIFDAQLVDNIGVRTQLNYFKIDSNLPNYRTNNLSVSVGPTVRF
ncbi:MAG: tetratricopeptide repeat protein [Rhodopseudomonas sp.]|uniref:tetratricopeptide repeat protein n=1 Tax=Rhodopseudomonas sp. TaxID=1078 RepID=UPI0017D41DD6|nr:tetratricopeptide repeat protein [Rhodopseudomonas sp.]NVN88608.1 tetratricopeptide repeat protein [Rhodopseudomonas sp.]